MTQIEVLSPQEAATLTGKVEPTLIADVTKALWSVLDTDQSIFIPTPTERDVSAIRMRLRRAGAKLTTRRVIRNGQEGMVLSARTAR